LAHLAAAVSRPPAQRAGLRPALSLHPRAHRSALLARTAFACSATDRAAPPVSAPSSTFLLPPRARVPLLRVARCPWPRSARARARGPLAGLPEPLLLLEASPLEPDQAEPLGRSAIPAQRQSRPRSPLSMPGAHAKRPGVPLIGTAAAPRTSPIPQPPPLHRITATEQLRREETSTPVSTSATPIHRRQWLSAHPDPLFASTTRPRACTRDQDAGSRTPTAAPRDPPHSSPSDLAANPAARLHRPLRAPGKHPDPLSRLR